MIIKRDPGTEFNLSFTKSTAWQPQLIYVRYVCAYVYVRCIVDIYENMSLYGLFSLWLRVLEQVSACMRAYLCVRASVCICVSSPVPSSSAGYWQSWQHVDYQTHRKLRPVGHQVAVWETSLPSEWWDNRGRERMHAGERGGVGGRLRVVMAIIMTISCLVWKRQAGLGSGSD